MQHKVNSVTECKNATDNGGHKWLGNLRKCQKKIIQY